MTLYILVQSLKQFYFARHKYGLENIVWITTSPAIQNFFENNKYNFENLESLINLEEYNEITNIIFKNSPDFSKIDSLKNINDLNLESYFLDEFNAMAAIFFYKTFLIINLIEKRHGKIIFITSENGLSKFDRIFDKGFKPGKYRFVDLFSRIAKKYFPAIIIDFVEEDSELLIKKEHQVSSRRMLIYEKILSLLNNNFSSYCFKIFKFLCKKKIIKKIRLNFFKKRQQIVIASSSDHIEESFISLLIKGYEVSFIFDLENYKFEKPNENDIINDLESSQLCKNIYIQNFINNKNIFFHHLYKDIISEIFFELARKSAELKKNLPAMEAHAINLYVKYQKDHLFLSKDLWGSFERYYLMFLKKKNNKIILTEHGVGHGAMPLYKSRLLTYPMILADVGVYYWNTSLKYLKDYVQLQKIFVAGFPRKMINTNLGFIKKYIIKKLLRIKNKKRCICIVADIERNNFMSGPYIENDHMYYNTTRFIVEYICLKFPEKNICLKLYPTNRYMSNYDFEDMKLIYPNLIVTRFLDLRFLRDIFDEFYTSSGQSTLGWLLGSKAKVFFLEKKFQPCDLQEYCEKEYNFLIKNVKRVFLMKKIFFTNNNNWIHKI